MFLVIVIILVIVSGNPACSSNSSAHETIENPRSSPQLVSTPTNEWKEVFSVSPDQAITKSGSGLQF